MYVHQQQASQKEAIKAQTPACRPSPSKPNPSSPAARFLFSPQTPKSPGPVLGPTSFSSCNIQAQPLIRPLHCLHQTSNCACLLPFLPEVFDIPVSPCLFTQWRNYRKPTRRASGSRFETPAMEADVQLPVLQLPLLLLRHLRAGPIERRLLPDELCHRGAPDPVPQPALASDLSHRIPPRRAAGTIQKKKKR
ncbi:hypothetical protein ACFX12_023625 [Malus domestica]